MKLTRILIPLNHYKNNVSVYHQQTEIQIINSARLNNFIKLDKSTQEYFGSKDYIKLISDNEINRFFSYKKREKYFSQPYLCIPIKDINEISKEEIFFITHAIFAFLRLYDSLFGENDKEFYNFESWGEWCSAPGYYNTICIYQKNSSLFFYDLIIDKPSLRLKDNIFSEISDIYKYLNMLPNLLYKDRFLTNLLCSYNNLYSLVIEENFNDFVLLGISLLENIFPNKNLEKAETLARQVSDNIQFEDISKIQIYDTITFLYKKRNSLVHYYHSPENSPEFYSKTYEFQPIDVFENYKNSIYIQERCLFRIIEKYIINYIKDKQMESETKKNKIK